MAVSRKDLGIDRSAAVPLLGGAETRPNGSVAVPMKPHFLVVGAAALLLAGEAPRSDEAQKEREKLQGTWNVASMELDGQRASDEIIRQQKPWVIKGDKIITDEKDGTLTYKVDPTKKPKAIDVTSVDPDVKSSPGIYLLEGDTWKLCLAHPPNKERPTELAAKKGSGAVLIVLRRAKRGGAWEGAPRGGTNRVRG
jgi:uncharacterized protein (TIGR03067 family)